MNKTNKLSPGLFFKRQLLWFACLSLLIPTACDKADEDGDIPEQTSAVTISLNTDAVTGKPLRDVHLYCFDKADKLVLHNYYEKTESLTRNPILLKEGYYTIITLFNTESGLIPSKRTLSRTETEATRADELPDISLSDFIDWLPTVSESYSDLLTGMIQSQLTQGPSPITMEIKNGLAGIGVADVTLQMTFPSPLLPDFVMQNSRATGTEVGLRTVIEAYKSGTEERVLRKETFVTKVNEEGLYTAKITLLPGDYDLRLWGDYAADANTDNHYITTNLKMVKVQPKEKYTANTDTRDAFSQTASVTVAAESLNKQITMHRPLAKYRLVATDVAAYEEMRRTRQLPPLEELSVTVVYGGFMPCAYNIVESKPNDSQTGYQYASTLSGQSDKEATVGKDFIFVDDKQSSVVVNVLFKDKNGKIVSNASDIHINYRAGYLTTVRGDFLTAGTGGGVVIDTEWEGNYEVEF